MPLEHLVGVCVFTCIYIYTVHVFDECYVGAYVVVLQDASLLGKVYDDSNGDVCVKKLSYHWSL